MKCVLELDVIVEEYGWEFFWFVVKFSSEIRDVFSCEEISVEDVLKWFDEDKWENVLEYICLCFKYYYFYEMMKVWIYEYYFEFS